MNRVISWFKNFKLEKTLMVLMSSLLLLVSTAFYSGEALAKTADQVRKEVPSSALTSPYEGGMNDYSDVDPRENITAAQAKTQVLIDNAERHVIDQTDDVATNTNRILNKKGENARELGENLKDSAEDVADQTQRSVRDFAKGTNQGIENIKDNTQDATADVTKETKRAAENIKQNTQDAGKDLAAKAQDTADKTSTYIQNKADQSASSTRQALRQAADILD